MSATAADHVRVVDAWNDMARLNGLSIVRMMPPARTASLKARIKEVGVDGMIEAIDRIRSSSHCNGGNDRGWHADFDFLITASRLTRILEGRYDDHRPAFRNGAAELLAQEMMRGPAIEDVPTRVLEGPGNAD